MRRDLTTPPIPIHSERKQGDADVPPETDMGFTTDQVESTIKVYEVWQVFLENDGNEDDLDNVFVVISAEFTTKGYRNGDWSNIEYRGFYTTQQEAINEITGHLR